MNELRTWNYNNVDIRTVEIDGEPWWVLKDVCVVLAIGNSGNVAARLDDDEKGIHTADTLGGKQDLTVISESGLYNVILRSNKPEAKEFKRWVTHEVLPSIRRTGGYQSKPMTATEILAAQSQILVNMERNMQQIESTATAAQEKAVEVEQKLDKAIETLAAPSVDHWQQDINKQIDRILNATGMARMHVLGDLYEELEQLANCRLLARLNRLRQRARKAGSTYKETRTMTKLDAIAADKQLRAIYTDIVRRAQVKYCK